MEPRAVSCNGVNGLQIRRSTLELTGRLSKMAAGIRFERMDPLSQIAEFQIPSLKPLDQPAVYNIASGWLSCRLLTLSIAGEPDLAYPNTNCNPESDVLVFGAGGIGMDADRPGGQPMAVSVEDSLQSI